MYYIFLVLVISILFVTRQKWLFKTGPITRSSNSQVMESSYVNLSHGKTHYVLKGPKDGELVVFIHGFSVPSEPYLAVGIDQYYVNAGFRFLALDLYGRGYSDTPDTRYTPALLSSQLAELLYALNITEPFHLIGLSMGGGVASHFAQVYPDLVKKLVLLSSVGYELKSHPLIHLVHIPVLGEFIFKNIAIKILVDNYPNDWINTIFRILNPDGNRDEIPKKKTSTDIEDFKLTFGLTKQHLIENKGLLRAMFSTLKNFPLNDIGDIIDAISNHPRKVLIVHGDSDGLIPYPSALQMKSTLKNSSILTISGGKHNIVIEKKDEIHPKIVTFLK